LSVSSRRRRRRSEWVHKTQHEKGMKKYQNTCPLSKMTRQLLALHRFLPFFVFNWTFSCVSYKISRIICSTWIFFRPGLLNSTSIKTKKKHFKCDASGQSKISSWLITWKFTLITTQKSIPTRLSLFPRPCLRPAIIKTLHKRFAIHRQGGNN
jgi:hypothetical protein